MTGKVNHICMPVKGTPPENVVRGSLVKKCDTCGQEIWVSKASLAYSGGQTLMCTNCFFEKTEKNLDDLEFTQPTEGQIQEIEDHFKED